MLMAKSMIRNAWYLGHDKKKSNETETFLFTVKMKILLLKKNSWIEQNIHSLY